MKKYLDLFKQTWTEFGEDKAPRLGAALAYYTIFSIAPLLLLAVAIAGMVFGQEAATNQISSQLSRVFGAETAKSIEEMIENAAKPATGTFATIVGIITLFLGASGVFGQLKDALNTIWDVDEKKSGGFLGLIKGRFLSMAMVMGVVFLLLVSLIFDAVIAAMGEYMTGLLPGTEALLQGASFVISFALVTGIFAMIFRYLPDVSPRIEWRDVWFGAAFTAFLFTVGKIALGLYLGKGAVGSAYGAAGSLVVLLVWVYWSAQILFFGAEFTQVYARSRGSKKEEVVIPTPSEVEGEGSGVRAARSAVSSPTPPGSLAHARDDRRGGGAIKLAIGGVLGLLLGTIAGAISAVVVMFKSVKRLLVWK
jgi:membrane protein